MNAYNIQIWCKQYCINKEEVSMKKIFLGGIVLLSVISMSAFKVFDGKLVHLVKG